MPDIGEDAPERPLLRPWVTTDTAGPVLMYADARGRTLRLRLDGVDVARLVLTAVEAQAELARRDLNGAVQSPRL